MLQFCNGDRCNVPSTYSSSFIRYISKTTLNITTEKKLNTGSGNIGKGEINNRLCHFKDNMDIFDFQLTEYQMRIIDSVNINSRIRYDSDNCEWDQL